MRKITDLGLTDLRIPDLVREESDHQIKRDGLKSQIPSDWLNDIIGHTETLSLAVFEYEYRGKEMGDVANAAIVLSTAALKMAEMYLNSPLTKPEE